MPVDIRKQAERAARLQLERFVGSALEEGATAEAIDAALADQKDEQGQPAPIADSPSWRKYVENLKRRPLLTASDLKRYGGRNRFRALFGLPPIDDEPSTVEAPTAVTTPCTLDQAHAEVRRWLSDRYDIDAFNAMLATVAAERLDGDPLWLLVISGPGFTKTETVIAAAGAGALVTSTIASEGALLSGSSTKERSKDATGGLLRRIGKRGVLVIKDVTTILSMNRESRATVLAALREIFDGKWERNVGSDGGKSIGWNGRLAVIGACTTEWDQAHAVIASMGDRFVIIRLDSTKERIQTGRQALANIGHEEEMREALKRAAGGVIAGMNTEPLQLTQGERERILSAADLVTQCRTAVVFDNRGEVVDVHAPEAPTRFAKQLAQIVRGGCAIGLSRERAFALALRCARDSMPPRRLEILKSLAKTGEQMTVTEVREDVDRPWQTVKRELEALNMLRLATQITEEEAPTDPEGKPKIRRSYSLAPGVRLDVLVDGALGQPSSQPPPSDRPF
jgi:DNA-binding transcriptional ArsR family regulator